VSGICAALTPAMTATAATTPRCTLMLFIGI
jgi:hypothetical protein